ncbi:MAG TPA: hypothetical protein VLB47_10620, partial [Solirubrobacteraceae bacterium]|nr:hypothetical protein [Solirubrobacteraceae bacterium]
MTRLLAVPVVAVVLVAGVWVAGGVVTNDYRASMALTAAWFGIAGAACLALALRRRALRVPVLGTYVLVAGAVGGYLALTTLRDRVVDERVVTGVAAGMAAVGAAGGADSGDARGAR